MRPEGTKKAKLVVVIETKAMRGLGTKKDPVREITQYWDLDGNFLAEMDTEHLVPLIKYEAEVIKHEAEVIKASIH